jgi:ELWxxDGT repeat protein
LFFYFRDKDYNFEPWISDGTSEGTFMLKDINSNGSSKPPSNQYGNILIYKNIALFVAKNLEFGEEIWYTDFTSNETNILRFFLN